MNLLWGELRHCLPRGSLGGGRGCWPPGPHNSKPASPPPHPPARHTLPPALPPLPGARPTGGREEAALPLPPQGSNGAASPRRRSRFPSSPSPPRELKPLFHTAAAAHQLRWQPKYNHPEGKKQHYHRPPPPRARELPGWKRRPRSETSSTRPPLAFRGRPV